MLTTILTTFIVGMALLILPSKAVEAYKQNYTTETTEQNKSNHEGIK